MDTTGQHVLHSQNSDWGQSEEGLNLDPQLGSNNNNNNKKV